MRSPDEVYEEAGNRGWPVEMINKSIALTDGIAIFIDGPADSAGHSWKLSASNVDADDLREIADLLDWANEKEGGR